LRLTAQTTDAIEGLIPDASGASVPNAAVELTSEATGVVTSSISP